MREYISQFNQNQRNKAVIWKRPTIPNTTQMMHYVSSYTHIPIPPDSNVTHNVAILIWSMQYADQYS